MPLDHKTILKHFDHKCHNCGVKNYSVVTVTNDMKWDVHPEFIDGSLNYESARDIANTMNYAEDCEDWHVVVLRVYTTQEGDAPLCILCSGKPMPKIKKKDEKPKELQHVLFR